VSFYVDASGWDDDWYYKDGGWHPDGDPCYDRRYHDGDDYYDDWDDRYDDRRGDPGRPLVRDRFRMNDCSDDYRVGFDAGRVDGAIDIDCVASSKGDPTEIVGRIRMDDHWGDDVLFRLDVEGEHGERPEYGRVFVRQWGGVRVEVEVTGLRLASTKPWQTPRLKWIEFDVRVFGR